MSKKDPPKGSRFDALFSVAKQDEASPPDASELKASESDRTPAPPQQLSKSKDPEYQRTTVYLPKAIHRKLKAAAVEEGQEMSDIIEGLIEQWLSDRKGR